jgi:hypothetical protein
LAPTKLYRCGDKGTKVVIAVLWMVALLFSSVVLFLPVSYKMDITLCTRDPAVKVSNFLKNLAEYTNFPLMAFFVLVVILSNLISLIYTFVLTRDQPHTNYRQANITVLAISLGMILCYFWLPNIMMKVYGNKDGVPRSVNNIQKYAVPLTCASSLINPVLYTTVNKGFKRFVVQVVKRSLERTSASAQEIVQRSSHAATHDNHTG